MFWKLNIPFGELTNEERVTLELATRLGETLPAADIDEKCQIPQPVLKNLAEQGFFGLGFPQELGGCFVSETATGLAVLALSYYCASTGIVVSVHNSLVGAALKKFCSEDQKRAWFPKLSSGEWIACFSLSEAEAGSDAKNIKSELKRSGETVILNGQKAWVTNGPYAGFCLLILRDAETSALTAVGVDMNVSGIMRHPPEQKLGIRGAQTCALSLNNAQISKDCVIADVGDGLKVALHGLNHGRLGVACQSLGIAWRAFAEAFSYAQNRIAFGQKLTNHQMIQGYLADMRTKLDVATTYVFSCLRNSDRSPRECAQAKLFASETAIEVVDRALQIFGGNGYVKDYVVERLYRDVRITTIYEGSSEIQRINISKFLIKELG